MPSTSAPRQLEAKVASLIKKKKLPTIPNMTLVKDDELSILLSSEHGDRLVHVRMGLYEPGLFIFFFITTTKDNHQRNT